MGAVEMGDSKPLESPLKAARDSASKPTRVPEFCHKDALLQRLTKLTEEGKDKTIVCGQYFHDSLLVTTDDSEEEERVEREVAAQIEEERRRAAENGTYYFPTRAC